MKVIIAGDRNCKDYDVIDRAVKQSGFKITEVVSGAARGIDELGERWARENCIPVKRFPADWDNLEQPGAVIKTKKWDASLKYNANAGFYRNEQMAKYGDALIAIQPNGNTSGTQQMIRMAKKHNLKVHIYEKSDDEYEFFF